uniref:Lipoprotein n=1 Tax=Strongyloides venezuelensis TaxID=75913 RepID=A0A0K0FXB1_STRVS
MFRKYKKNIAINEKICLMGGAIFRLSTLFVVFSRFLCHYQFFGPASEAGVSVLANSSGEDITLEKKDA